MRLSVPVCNAISISPRQPSTHADAQAHFPVRRRQVRADSPAGMLVQDQADQAHRFEHFLEAHDDARRDVAVAMGRHAHVELVIGSARELGAQIPGLAAGAPGKPVNPSCAAKSGVTRPVVRKRSCAPACSS